MNTPNTEPNTEPEWRPLEPGEILRDGDQASAYGGPWTSQTGCEGVKYSLIAGDRWRTRRPKPESATTPDTPNTEPKWRPLEPGEIIQDGDEIFRHGAGPWEPAQSCLGIPWGDFIHEARTRRPRPASATTPDTTELDAPCYVDKRERCPKCNLPHTGDHRCSTGDRQLRNGRSSIVCVSTPEIEWAEFMSNRSPDSPGLSRKEQDEIAKQHPDDPSNCGTGDQQTARECQCDMRTKLVGDGCPVCNPEYWAEMTKPETAREWVTEQLGIAGDGTTKYYALEESDSYTLADRCDRAEQQSSIWEGRHNDACIAKTNEMLERRRMQAERDQLREALEDIAKLYENAEPPTTIEIAQRAYDMRCVARAALNQTTNDQ